MKPVELRGHDRQINVVKFNFDGDLLFTGGADKKVCLYDTFTYEKLGSYHTTASVKTIDVDINSEFLFVGNYNGLLEIFNVQSGEILGKFERGWKIKFLQVVPGNKQILITYEKMGVDKICEVCLYDFKDLISSLQKAKNNHLQFEDYKAISTFTLNMHLTKVAYGYLNKYLIVTTSCGKIIKLDTTGKQLLQEQANDGECKGFSFAPDFSLIATCGQDGVKIFDPETLKIIRTLKTEVPMNTVAISPLACNEGDKKFHLLMAGGIPAREAAMSKKGGFEIQLCNIMYEKLIGTIAGSFSPINSIEYMPDGKGFCCGAEEGVSKIIKFDPKYYEHQ